MASVNKLFQESFDTTFMKNIKTIKKLVIFFSHKIL